MPTERSSALSKCHQNNTILVRSGGRKWTIQSEKATLEKVQLDKLSSLAEIAPTAAQHADSVASEPIKPSTLRQLCERFSAWLDGLLTQRPEGGEPILGHSLGRMASDGRTVSMERLKESFAWGAEFGLLLGCLCVVGVHAVHERPSTPPDVVSLKQPSPVTSVSSGPPITVPAVRLYGLYFSRTAAANTRRVSTNPSSSTWHLWRVAAYSSDLLHYKTMGPDSPLHPVWRIMPLRWNIHAVSTLSTASTGNVTRVSTWLAGEVSALNALAGALSDDEPGRDAWTAFKTAKSLTPKDNILNATGKASELHDFAADVQTSFTKCAHGELGAAATSVNAAYEILERLQ